MLDYNAGAVRRRGSSLPGQFVAGTVRCRDSSLPGQFVARTVRLVLQNSFTEAMVSVPFSEN